MNGENIACTVTALVTMFIIILFIGYMAYGSITLKIYKDKTDGEKRLIRYMNNYAIIIMTTIVCALEWIEFDVLACFALLIPVVMHSVEDALCSTRFIEVMTNYTFALLFVIGFTLTLASFSYKALLGIYVVRLLILSSITAVPVKTFMENVFMSMNARLHDSGIDEGE